VAIVRLHIPWYEEVFRIDGVLADPTVLFGVQPIWVDPIYFVSVREALRTRQTCKKGLRHAKDVALKVGGRMPPTIRVPAAYNVAGLKELLLGRGVTQIDVLDLFDPRAELRLDMNKPIAAELQERYATLIDVGSIEHVFDTRQCIENCIQLVRPGGYYVLVAPVKGWFGHGLHTFHPEALTKTVELNGFAIVYERYSTIRGHALDNPAAGEDVLLWMVARKSRSVSEFVIPQQGYWVDYYAKREDGSLVHPNP
jgi:hypothetical protein